jgi:hypothetical protein
VHGDFAYIGNTYVGLVVVDTSDPAHPYRRGSVDTFDWMYNVVTDGSIVYANLGHNRLGVYDVTDPDAPRSIRELQLPEWLHTLQLTGDRLFTAATPGVRVYDVSTPDDPIEVGTAEAQGLSLQIRDRFLYMTGGGSCLVLGSPTSGIDAQAPANAGLRITASNPSRRDTEIRVQLACGGPLRVVAYDAAGRRVITLHEGVATAGNVVLKWREPALAGTYFVRAESQGRSMVRQLLRLE